MNRRLRRKPPKQTFAQRSGRSIRPMSLPAALKIITPTLPAPPPPAAPQVAVDVDAQAVGDAAALDGHERSPVGELRAVIDDVVNAENLRRHAIFYDV